MAKPPDEEIPDEELLLLDVLDELLALDELLELEELDEPVDEAPPQAIKNQHPNSVLPTYAKIL